MKENKNDDIIDFDQLLTSEERQALGLIADEKQRAFKSLPLIFWIQIAIILLIGIFWSFIAIFYPTYLSNSMLNFSLYSQNEAVMIIQTRGQRIVVLLAIFILALYKKIAIRYVVQFIAIFLIYNTFKDIQYIFNFGSFKTSPTAILFLTTRTIIICSLIYIWLTLRQISHIDKVFPRKFSKIFLKQ